MIPGPDLIYKCPKCGRKAVCGSIRSGNTCGARFYSDGKRIAPMLPEFPYIIKCKGCMTFYWLEEENNIGEYEYWDNKNGKNTFKGEDIDRARFLSLNEHVEAINLKIYNTVSEERFLRVRLWWAFNDNYREGGEIILNNDDRDIYESNCVKLIEISDKNEIDEKIRCAELYRNLGDYVECKNILETIHDKEYGWIKKLLKKECEKNNKRVIRLSR
jgi:hypothetical protein